MYDALFVWIIMCLFELLILIQIARAINRVVKKLEDIDKSLCDLDDDLDDNLIRIWNILNEKEC